ncbi:MAG: NAD(P)/FAD-dependent oxidoreductase [Acidobacteria bacterium]|nr:NAD(P)/FAD-dependent oxidoreductase [Acidobacteriota bacterium]MDW7983783.1 NAD(P)/FAD-dependent oxidoreductase [Acidobacteriota bacterium]
MARRYDVIVIGAGHNGLVAAAYLARAGRSVCVLERRPVLGGACTTETLWGQYRVSTAAYVCGLLHPKIVRDLELSRHGFEILRRDPSSFTPLPDGGYLLLGTDPALNAEQIQRFSRRDAEAFERYEAALDRLGRFVEPLLTTVPPRFPDGRLLDLPVYWRLLARVLRLPPVERLLLSRLPMASAWDVLSDWFESEPLKVTLATDGVIGSALSPTRPTTALVLFHHVMGSITGRRGVWGYVRGGMGALSEAIAAVARRYGAVIQTNAEVQTVLVRNGRAAGVVLADGTEIEARVVLSNADPKRTFLRLVPRQVLPADFVDRIERLRMSAASMKINLIADGLPNFQCLPGDRPGPHHRATIHLCPSLDYLERAFADFAQGRPSERPMVEMCIPSVLDETLAPDGRHVVSLFVQYAPYEPPGGWAIWKDELVRRVLDVIDEYAPGFSSRILHCQALSPQDLEEVWALTGGNIFHGDLIPDQMFVFRPVAGWAQYRTPLPGLYLCGAGAHPGGGVIGAAGHNAAQAVLRDRSAHSS